MDKGKLHIKRKNHITWFGVQHKIQIEKNGRRIITIEIIGAAKKKYSIQTQRSKYVHVTNTRRKWRWWRAIVGAHNIYLWVRKKQAKLRKSIVASVVCVCVYLCTWPFILAATAVCVAAATAAAATSLITFEAWLHWKANHVPSNCLCATRLNFIWLVTSRPFTTLTESVLFDAWFFRLVHSISFGCEATHPASHSVSQPASQCSQLLVFRKQSNRIVSYCCCCCCC